MSSPGIGSRPDRLLRVAKAGRWEAIPFRRSSLVVRMNGEAEEVTLTMEVAKYRVKRASRSADSSIASSAPDRRKPCM